MTDLTKSLLKENATLCIKHKIGNAQKTLEYLEKHFGITTLEELENAQNGCLVIEYSNGIYYNNSSC